MGQLKDMLDLLVVFVGFWRTVNSYTELPDDWLLTSKFRLRDDFTKQLREVWKVFAEELRLNNKRLASVV